MGGSSYRQRADSNGVAGSLLTLRILRDENEPHDVSDKEGIMTRATWAGTLCALALLCDQGSGALGACPGVPAGQDGWLQKGLARSYTDNGDGTITDNKTGLMWEKKDH